MELGSPEEVDCLHGVPALPPQCSAAVLGHGFRLNTCLPTSLALPRCATRRRRLRSGVLLGTHAKFNYTSEALNVEVY